MLDPIDGTRGFVGMRQYAVCLGMLQDGEVVLGVLGCPNLPQAVVGDDDGGAGERGGLAVRSSQRTHVHVPYPLLVILGIVPVAFLSE